MISFVFFSYKRGVRERDSLSPFILGLGDETFNHGIFSLVKIDYL